MTTDPQVFAVSVLEDVDYDLKRARHQVDAMLQNLQRRAQLELDEVWRALITHALERYWKELMNPLGAMNDTFRDLKGGVDVQLEATDPWSETPPSSTARP